MGDGLSSLNVKELKQLENRLETGISKHEMFLAESEALQKREIELEQENVCRWRVMVLALYSGKVAFQQNTREKIADNDRLQQISIMPPGQDYNEMQAYIACNLLHFNMLEGVPIFSTPDKKSLQLG